MRTLAMVAGILVVLALPGAALGATEIVVQGTTDTRDAGLVDDVIVPGFQAAYPQYTLQYIAVGTGQALTNAKAGQGDAVMTHSAPLEAEFVAQGYSYEPVGRAVMYSDYLIAAHNEDPAGVEAGARHDAVHAFELIAAAATAGNAVFVSRGDNSGTNVQEQLMWGLTSGVPLHPVGPAGSGRMEPDGNGDGTGTDVPGWYKKAGVGQAATLKVAEQCNFPPASATACYDLTDRGTFNRQVATGAIAGMKVASDENSPNARGGTTLLLNQFNAYVVNPAKVPTVKLEGALAFLDYMTSAGLPGEADQLSEHAAAGLLPGRVPADHSRRASAAVRPGGPAAHRGGLAHQPPARHGPAGRRAAGPRCVARHLGISVRPTQPGLQDAAAREDGRQRRLQPRRRPGAQRRAPHQDTAHGVAQPDHAGTRECPREERGAPAGGARPRRTAGPSERAACAARGGRPPVPGGPPRPASGRGRGGEGTEAARAEATAAAARAEAVLDHEGA